jgi:hypothetical protein
VVEDIKNGRISLPKKISGKELGKIKSLQVREGDRLKRAPGVPVISVKLNIYNSGCVFL